MIIDTMSEEMFWILCKVNKDMLDFLESTDPKRVLETIRGEWIKSWQKDNLNPEILTRWLPTKRKK